MSLDSSTNRDEITSSIVRHNVCNKLDRHNDSELDDYPLDITGILPTVKALVDRYATLAASTRKAIQAADSAGDESTADLFTEVSRGLDKALWFLEAHLQE